MDSKTFSKKICTTSITEFFLLLNSSCGIFLFSNLKKKTLQTAIKIATSTAKSIQIMCFIKPIQSAFTLSVLPPNITVPTGGSLRGMHDHFAIMNYFEKCFSILFNKWGLTFLISAHFAYVVPTFTPFKFF